MAPTMTTLTAVENRRPHEPLPPLPPSLTTCNGRSRVPSSVNGIDRLEAGFVDSPALDDCKKNLAARSNWLVP